MAGNTRGKLKEHFEGIHRNLDWCIQHVNTSLQLIESQIRQQQQFTDPPLTEEQIQAKIEEYPLHQGIKALGESINIMDEMASGIYANL
jgi:hypothetical protein